MGHSVLDNIATLRREGLVDDLGAVLLEVPLWHFTAVQHFTAVLQPASAVDPFFAFTVVQETEMIVIHDAPSSSTATDVDCRLSYPIEPDVETAVKYCHAIRPRVGT